MMRKSTVNTPAKDMRIWISIILRSGVLISALLILAGGILFTIQHPHEIPTFKVFSGQPDRLKHIKIIFAQAAQLRSRSIIQAGIIILIATPVLRVIFSLIDFLVRKDWVFVLITSIVLTGLFYSLLGN